MHFLLTNDDGIEAPGLAAMAEAVRQIPGATLDIVAPDVEQSQCGHRVTTRETLQVVEVGSKKYKVSGTPADCVRAAIFGLGIKPDFVLSGINAGGNMGQDIVISGTIAGAREAAYHGLRSAAISHYLVSGLKVDWPRTSEWASQIISRLVAETLQDGEFWNVNFPHLSEGQKLAPATTHTEPSRSPLNVSFQIQSVAGAKVLQYDARYADRPADPGSDVEVCFGGGISISRLSV